MKTKVLGWIKLLIIQFVILCILLEAGTRIYRYFATTVYNSKLLKDDSELGWRVAENFSKEEIVPGFGKVKYSTKKGGFRLFGNTKTRKKKLFFIGDSFMQARGVNDGECMYDYFQKHSDSLEVFAYGCGGYGSLQEYLFLKKYIDEINPDIIVWQFCMNDIKDNSFDFDASSVSNQYRTRPYLMDGNIEMKFPKKSFGWLYKYSKFLGLLSIKLNVLGNKKVAKDFMEGHKKEEPMVKEALHITGEIMKRTRALAGNRKILAFSANSVLTEGINTWVDDSLNTICKRHQVDFIPRLPEEIFKVHHKGEKIDGYPPDGHWNNRGHAIAAAILMGYMKKNNWIGQE